MPDQANPPRAQERWSTENRGEKLRHAIRQQALTYAAGVLLNASASDLIRSRDLMDRAAIEWVRAMLLAARDAYDGDTEDFAGSLWDCALESEEAFRRFVLNQKG